MSAYFGATLSPGEEEVFVLLGGYESGYIAKSVVVQRADTEEDMLAFTFVREDVSYFVAPPSEAYLMAIWLHLKQHWDIESLSVSKYVDVGKIEKLSEWAPSDVGAMPLHVFVVLVNNHKDKVKRWKMPHAITGIQEKLASIGIKSTAELRDFVRTQTEDEVNRELVACGQRAFSPNTLSVIKSLLQ
jgi:hypothetical protein